MTEDQVWFILIFTLPFLPALVVFRLLPHNPDANTGAGEWKFPLLGALSVKLQGAILAYVVVCAIAMAAFYLITRSGDSITITLVPNTELNPEQLLLWKTKIREELQVELRLPTTRFIVADFFLKPDDFALGKRS